MSLLPLYTSGFQGNVTSSADFLFWQFSFPARYLFSNLGPGGLRELPEQRSPPLSQPYPAALSQPLSSRPYGNEGAFSLTLMMLCFFFLNCFSSRSSVKCRPPACLFLYSDLVDLSPSTPHSPPSCSIRNRLKPLQPSRLCCLSPIFLLMRAIDSGPECVFSRCADQRFLITHFRQIQREASRMGSPTLIVGFRGISQPRIACGLKTRGAQHFLVSGLLLQFCRRKNPLFFQLCACPAVCIIPFGVDISSIYPSWPRNPHPLLNSPMVEGPSWLYYISSP